MRRRVTFVLPLFLVCMVAAGFGATRYLRDADAAGAILHHPEASCGAAATVTLSWRPAPGTTNQHLQISLHDNDFAAGTFTSVRLDADVETYTMAALDRDIPSYWRIVSEANSGQAVSATKTFVPCGGPFLLWGPLECRGYTSASVRFRWAPAANHTGRQWIEFDSNGDWTGADFWTAGPYSAATDTARRSGFQDGVGYLFRVVRETNGQRQVSSVGWFMPNCAPYVNPDNYGTDDRLVIPAINVDAPVNIRDVGPDGLLGVPTGGYDVVKYNFAYMPHLAGEIAGPGPVLIGGHYDYYVIGPAVFWDLAKTKAGDVVEYWDGDVRYVYVVDWVTTLAHDQALNGYLESAGDRSLLLVTCHGTFDRDQFGGYDQRVLVHATLVE